MDIQYFNLIASQLGFKEKDKVKPIPFPIQTIEEVQGLAQRYQKEGSRFLLTWLYLTGQRINEALRLKRSDVSKQLIKNQEFIVVNSITLKNKSQPRRSIPIPLFGKEKEMSEFVWKRIENLSLDSMIFARLSRTNAWNLLAVGSIKTMAIMPPDPTTKEQKLQEITLKIYPHYLRHCKATHMASIYGYDLYKLMQFFGWSTPTVATIYATLNWRTLAEGFIQMQRPFEATQDVSPPTSV